MKRFIVLAVMAAFVLGAFGTASAVELKTKGSMRISANWSDNKDFKSTDNGGQYEDDFSVWQRLRVEFSFVANENLMARTQFEIGDTAWGRNEGAFDTDKNVVEVPRAYLQFRWPDTSVLITAGKMPLALPDAGYFGSVIFDENISALTVNIPVNDMIGVLVGYARALDGDTKNMTAKKYDDELDLAFLALPITPEGFGVTPFFVYGFMGKDTVARFNGGTEPHTSSAYMTGASYKDNVNPWWAGLALNVTALDPFAFYFDINYGAIDDDDNRNDRKGWFADLALEYKGLDWFVPSIFGAYSTGLDDDPDNGDERMPTIDEGWSVGAFNSWTDSSAFTGTIANQTVGAWYLGMRLAKISFMDKLSHDITFLYARGTNDESQASVLTYGQDLTDKDAIFEIDLSTKYQIYEELSAVLEMGYIINDYDKDTWGVEDNSNAFQAALGLKYNF